MEYPSSLRTHFVFWEPFNPIGLTYLSQHLRREHTSKPIKYDILDIEFFIDFLVRQYGYIQDLNNVSLKRFTTFNLSIPGDFFEISKTKLDIRIPNLTDFLFSGELDGSIISLLQHQNKTNPILLYGWKNDLIVASSILKTIGVVHYVYSEILHNFEIKHIISQIKKQSYSFFFNMMNIRRYVVNRDIVIKCLFVYPLRGITFDEKHDYPYIFTSSNNKYITEEGNKKIKLFYNLNIKLKNLINNSEFKYIKLFLLSFHSIIFQYVVSLFITSYAPVLVDAGLSGSGLLSYKFPSLPLSVNSNLKIIVEKYSKGKRILVEIGDNRYIVPPITTCELIKLYTTCEYMLQLKSKPEFFLFTDATPLELDINEEVSNMKLKVLWDSDTNKHNIHIYSEETRQFLKNFLDKESDDFLFELLQLPKADLVAQFISRIDEFNEIKTDIEYFDLATKLINNSNSSLKRFFQFYRLLPMMRGGKKQMEIKLNKFNKKVLQEYNKKHKLKYKNLTKKELIQQILNVSN